MCVMNMKVYSTGGTVKKLYWNENEHTQTKYTISLINIARDVAVLWLEGIS